jgi:hypothetical protein
MNKRHLLWILVAVNVLLTFASVGAEGFFGWTLPPVLRSTRTHSSPHRRSPIPGAYCGSSSW